MRRTVQEIADELGTDRETADHLVKLLVKFGLATFKGERPNESGRGKGQHVYEVAVGAGKAVAKMIERLEK